MKDLFLRLRLALRILQGRPVVYKGSQASPKIRGLIPEHHWIIKNNVIKTDKLMGIMIV